MERLSLSSILLSHKLHRNKMEVFDKNGNKIELIQGIREVVITANPGFELEYNYSYTTDKLVYIICGIRKIDGFFLETDSEVAIMDVNCNLGTSYCGLGRLNKWFVNAIGYCFISGKAIVVSDRNGTGKQDRAYINLVCRLNN